MASKDQTGKTASKNVFPWKLRFQPTGKFEFPSTMSAGYSDFLTDLESIPSGSVLYDIFAMDKPEELGGSEQKIGQIKTASELTTSNWGDEHLYFRHERMDDDLALRPEWVPYTPKYTGLFNLAQDGESGCPFANLIQYLQ